MPTGMVTTYDLTTGVIVYMEDMIHSLDAVDVPLLGQYGADGRAAISKTNDLFEKKTEWLDETILVPKGTVAEALDNVETDLTLAAGNVNIFGVGDIIKVDSEVMRVTAVAGDGITLTITRGWAATTAAAHNINSTVIGLGKALPEGSDPETARSTDRTARYNVTEIFGPEKVEVSETEQVIRKYGLRGTTEFDHQAANRTKEMAIHMEQAILYGVRYEDNTTKTRSMGGFTYYITTNVDSSTTTLTDTALLDNLQLAWAAGGNPRVVLVGAKQKRTISAFDSTDIQLTRGDNGRGQIVDSFLSDFGQVSILLDRWVRDSDLFAYNPDQVELQTLRPLQFQMLAKTGDSRSGQLVAEKTLKFVRERHAMRMSALT